MKRWLGTAGLCVNDQKELLMVLQGNPDERKKWSVPSGGLEANETIRDCCRREIEEETGFQVEVGNEIRVKMGSYEAIQTAFEIHYFSAKVRGGIMKIQDPDHLIYEIAWKSSDEIKSLELTYPEDREFLINYLSGSIGNL
jgi:ADP-ribose pyrophosphatase YjhB (NUDIX family)